MIYIFVLIIYQLVEFCLCHVTKLCCFDCDFLVEDYGKLNVFVFRVTWYINFNVLTN